MVAKLADWKVLPDAWRMVRAARTISEKMIKVDHVGENGAVNIYRAQAMVVALFHPSLVSELKENQSHEESHRAIFDQWLGSNGIRRCISYHAGGAGGFVLGFVTALMGRKAIHATTYAVEHVVLQHLTEQMAYLRKADPSALSCVQQIHDDEQNHHDHARDALGAPGALDKMLIAIVRFCTNAVISFGMR